MIELKTLLMVGIDVREGSKVMNTEAKVGLFTIVSLGLLCFIGVQLGGYGFGSAKGYNVQAVFSQVNGLKSGDLVRYAGVEVGKITGVMPDGHGAAVTMFLNEGVKIPVGSTFVIGSDGLMGEKFIGIFPPNADIGEYIKPGDIVEGATQRDLNHLMVTADDVMKDMQQLLKSLNELFGDERLRSAMIDSAVNTKTLTANLSKMSEVLARMAISNEADVRSMVRNLTMMADNMASAAANIDYMLHDINNNGQTVADLTAAIHNLSTTSTRIEHMAIALEGVVTDPETADNLKVTLRNARKVSEKADRMMNQATNISTNFSTEVLYSGAKDRYMTNAEFRLNTTPTDFFLLGVNDIGEADKMNLQIGSGSDKFTGRVGVFDDKAGIGIDAYINPALKLSADAYDPNDLRVKIRAQYELANDTFLVGQTNDVNKRRDRTSFVGVRQAF